MNKITYNAELLKLMSLFEKVTRARLKDCFVDQNGLLTFIVKENEIGKAIGKKAVNVKKLQAMLKKNIRIVEYSDDPKIFTRNFIMPLRPESIEEKDGFILVKGQDSRAKGLLIGKNSKNVKNLNSVLKKYHKDYEVKII